jgi:hypothetical protein
MFIYILEGFAILAIVCMFALLFWLFFSVTKH